MNLYLKFKFFLKVTNDKFLAVITSMNFAIRRTHRWCRKLRRLELSPSSCMTEKQNSLGELNTCNDVTRLRIMKRLCLCYSNIAVESTQVVFLNKAAPCEISIFSNNSHVVTDVRMQRKIFPFEASGFISTCSLTRNVRMDYKFLDLVGRSALWRF